MSELAYVYRGKNGTVLPENNQEAIVEVATPTDLDLLIGSGVYAPAITNVTADVVVTAPNPFVWTRIGKNLTITGEISVVNNGLLSTDVQASFSMPGTFAGSQGAGVGAGFWEDGVRPATFTDAALGKFTMDHYRLDPVFTALVRFTYTCLL